MGTFIIKRQKDGQFMFNLKAQNGEIILTSEGYTTKQNCKNGIQSVKVNAATNEHNFFKQSHEKENKQFWSFKMLAKNGEIIGRSEVYESEASMENGIKSILENAPLAEIKDRSAWWYNIFK